MNTPKITLTLLFFFCCCTVLHAQQIKDGETIDLDGIAVTFSVVNKESVDVKGQSFDRYKVIASAQNNTGKAFNIRLKTYPDVASIGGGKIVELNCQNATGARLTSKKVEVSMATHQIKVTYLARNNDGKLVNSEMTIPAGYFLEPGQKVENDAIFIVPKGEALQVSVRKLL
ncbi:hypothetical protein GFS24_11440 [Chitinophaga sp. SYP-B3965]|uniref:hypothetical protein n=1 Tax=Chitinophaga sp. SYP-B3965 TaxID=2663120 RepID=UPI001299B70F|nr:hypothetical protein [Chitinophaga sp. SYP-B3965]MRG45733.1 hypothetical protein [Chitinophaga sp. SYP-B3965]